MSSESQKAAMAEYGDPFKEMEEEIANLCSIQPDLVSKNIYVEVLAVQLSTSGVEIVAKLLKTEDEINDNDDEIETKDEPVYCPDRNELLQIIATMRSFQKILKLSNLMRIILLA